MNSLYYYHELIYPNTIPMVLGIPDNPNIFTTDVTRITSAEGVIRVLNSLSWNGEIGWLSIFDVDNIADNNFELSSSFSKKYIYINGHASEKYIIKVDVFLNKVLQLNNKWINLTTI